ncbi:MAG: hypothetical protein HDT50_07135 [Lactobacillus sp.]|nr:hypothetical protein [Lactobacillus sp.]
MANELKALRLRIVVASVATLLLYITRFYVTAKLLVFVMLACAGWTCLLIIYYFWLVCKKIFK